MKTDMNTQAQHTPTPKFIAAWHGPSDGRGANQYCVADSGNHQPLAWFDTLDAAQRFAAKLNAYDANQRTIQALMEAMENVAPILDNLAIANLDQFRRTGDAHSENMHFTYAAKAARVRAALQLAKQSQ